jgi:hypothetical protein
VKLLFLIHDITYLIGVAWSVAEEAQIAPRTIKS